MLPIIVAIVLVLHGLVHLLGFVVPWRLATVEGMSYQTTVLAGQFSVGDAGIRFIGLIWLATAVGFVIAALGLATGQSWWLPATVAVVGVSLVLTVLGWPEAKAGFVVNLALLALLLAGSWVGLPIRA